MQRGSGHLGHHDSLAARLERNVVIVKVIRLGRRRRNITACRLLRLRGRLHIGSGRTALLAAIGIASPFDFVAAAEKPDILGHHLKGSPGLAVVADKGPR